LRRSSGVGWVRAVSCEVSESGQEEWVNVWPYDSQTAGVGYRRG
jgi:hypothetical protein